MRESNIDFRPFRKELVSALWKKRVILFVGAGLSKRCTFVNQSAPDWRELLSNLINKAESNGYIARKERLRELRRVVESDSNVEEYLMIASYLKHRFELFNDDLGGAVRSLVDGYDIDGAHRELTRLPIAGIITTNYDDYLERAFTDAGIHLTPLQPDESTPLNRFFKKGDPWIAKLHGRAGDSSDFTLSFEQYEARYGSDYAEFWLRSLMQAYTFLFVGFGFRDPAIMPILRRGATNYGPPFRRHFSFESETMIGEIKERFLAKHYNIFTIRYPVSDDGDAFSELTPCISSLADEAAPGNREPFQRVLFVIRHPTHPTKCLFCTHSDEWSNKKATKGIYLFPSIPFPHARTGDQLEEIWKKTLLQSFELAFGLGRNFGVNVEIVSKQGEEIFYNTKPHLEFSKYYENDQGEIVTLGGSREECLFIFQFLEVSLSQMEPDKEVGGGDPSGGIFEKRKFTVQGITYEWMDMDTVIGSKKTRSYNNKTIKQFKKIYVSDEGK